MNIWLLHPFAGGPGLGRHWRPFWLADAWTRMGHRPLVVSAGFHHLHKSRERLGRSALATSISGFSKPPTTVPVVLVDCGTIFLSGRGFARRRPRFRNSSERQISSSLRPRICSSFLQPTASRGNTKRNSGSKSVISGRRAL